MLTFTFSESTSVHNFLFISNSDVAVPELFLVVYSTDMTKYGSLLSSLHFRSFHNGLNSYLHKPITLTELEAGSLVYEVP